MDELWKSVYKDLLINGILVAVIGGAIKAYLSESLVVLRTSFLVASAIRKLSSTKLPRVMRAVHTLIEIAGTQPTRRQEMVDLLAENFFRRRLTRGDRQLDPTPKELVEICKVALRALLSLPRRDENGHGINIDLHQIRLVAHEGIYLEKLNLQDVVLWGSEFVKVDLSRSTFENADLGGVRFVQCGLEDVNMKNARLSYSYMDDRPTIIEDCNLARSSIDEALIIDAERPQVIVTRPRDVEPARMRALQSRGRSVQID